MSHQLAASGARPAHFKTILLLAGMAALRASRLGAQSIPVTRAESLAGNVVNLPADLKGRPAILVLGFSRKSSAQTKPWGDVIEHDFKSDSQINYYQLPMLEQVPRFIRGIVTDGIRKPLSSEQRTRFIPVFQDEAAWKRLAHFAGADDAYVLLIDGAGHVRWQTAGAFEKATYEDLRGRATALKDSSR